MFLCEFSDQYSSDGSYSNVAVHVATMAVIIIIRVSRGASVCDNKYCDKLKFDSRIKMIITKTSLKCFIF